jgi:hypothetical protein
MKEDGINTVILSGAQRSRRLPQHGRYGSATGALDCARDDR